MYDNVIHQGKTLSEWAQIFKNQYSLGELYRMTKSGFDFKKLKEKYEL